MSRVIAGVALVLLLLLMQPIPGARPAGADAADTTQLAYGSHIVARFWVPDGGYTSVLGIQAPSGDLTVIAYVTGPHLYISDGLRADGTVQYLHFDPPHMSGLNRLDVLLDGPTYRITAEGHTMTARTLVHATEGRPIADPGALFSDGNTELIQGPSRVDNDDLAREALFTNASWTDAWTPVEATAPGWEDVTAAREAALGDGEAFELRDKNTGRWGLGFLEILQDYEPGVTYVHTSVPDASGYGMEVSYAPDDVELLPRGQAVLAGISGDEATPQRHWAIVVDLPPARVNAWTLYLEEANGTRTQLVDPLFRSHWHDILVHVDEDAGTLSFRFDQGQQQTFHGLELAGADRIAAGDIRHDLGETLQHVPAAGLQGFYDDLAVYAEVSP